MSRYVAVVAVLIGPFVRVKIAPGYARSLEEADATADVLVVPRRAAAAGTEEGAAQ
jgi:hypothetical protein